METIQGMVNEAPLGIVIVMGVTMLLLFIGTALGCRAAYREDWRSFAVVYLGFMAMVFGAWTIGAIVALIYKLTK